MDEKNRKDPVDRSSEREARIQGFGIVTRQSVVDGRYHFVEEHLSPGKGIIFFDDSSSLSFDQRQREYTLEEVQNNLISASVESVLYVDAVTEVLHFQAVSGQAFALGEEGEDGKYKLAIVGGNTYHLACDKGEGNTVLYLSMMQRATDGINFS